MCHSIGLVRSKSQGCEANSLLFKFWEVPLGLKLMLLEWCIHGVSDEASLKGFSTFARKIFSFCFSAKLVEEGCMEQPCVHSTPSETNPDNAQSMGEAFEAVIGSVRVPSASMLHHCC